MGKLSRETSTDCYESIQKVHGGVSFKQKAIKSDEEGSPGLKHGTALVHPPVEPRPRGNHSRYHLRRLSAESTWHALKNVDAKAI